MCLVDLYRIVSFHSAEGKCAARHTCWVVPSASRSDILLIAIESFDLYLFKCNLWSNTKPLLCVLAGCNIDEAITSQIIITITVNIYEHGYKYGSAITCNWDRSNINLQNKTALFDQRLQ